MTLKRTPLKRNTPLKRTSFKSKPKVAEEKEVKKQRHKKTDRQKAIEKLDKVFSIYIRIKDATPHTGFVRCVSCGRVYHWKEIQNGHYASRSSMNLRFSPLNCHPQCMCCNVMMHGNMIEYRKSLIKKIGEDKVEWLEYAKNIPKQWSVYELEQMTTYYSALVEKIREEKGL